MGDLAPVPELLALAERFGALLVLDEAHATGLLGEDGAGALSLFGISDGPIVNRGHPLKGPRFYRRIRGRGSDFDLSAAEPVPLVHF